LTIYIILYGILLINIMSVDIYLAVCVYHVSNRRPFTPKRGMAGSALKVYLKILGLAVSTLFEV
jgi:hypothetical protein